MNKDNVNVRIRLMNESDLKWVINLGENTPEFNTETGAAQFFSLETLKKWIHNPDGVTLTAEVDGQRAGFLLGFYMAGPNDGYINSTVVTQEHRRIGIGRRLQDRALEEFSKKGVKGNKCDHVWSFVNVGDTPMLNLKKSLGFEIGVRGHYVEIMLPRKDKEN